MAFAATPLKIDLGNTDNTDAIGRTTIMYGDSTAGKSTQLAAAAEYMFAKTGRKIRLISAEDSSKSVFLPLMAEGKVDAIFVSKIADPVSFFRRLSRGEWPVIGKDGEYYLTPTDRGTVGAYVIEGLSTIAELFQEDNREKGRYLGEQDKNSHVENGERLSLPGQFSYGFVQMEMTRLLRTFAMIPDLDRVLWSSHEASGVDDDGKALRGPATVGKKAIGSISKYCGTLLHLDMVTENSRVIRRLHFRSHADPKVPTISSPCKITIPLKDQEAFVKLIGSGDKGYIDTTVCGGRLVSSLADFLEAEDKLMSKYLTK